MANWQYIIFLFYVTKYEIPFSQMLIYRKEFTVHASKSDSRINPASKKVNLSLSLSLSLSYLSLKGNFEYCNCKRSDKNETPSKSWFFAEKTACPAL